MLGETFLDEFAKDMSERTEKQRKINADLFYAYGTLPKKAKEELYNKYLKDTK